MAVERGEEMNEKVNEDKNTYMQMDIYMYINWERERERDTRSVMAIVVGNRYGDPNSKSKRVCLHFA